MKHNADKNQRKYKILQSIVEIFVSTANPVGSKFLKEEAKINLSTATLRNEMVLLEKEGFLMQSHISSGRIPTDKAYRFLVDTINISPVQGESFKNEFNTVALKYFQNKQADQNVYDIVSILSQLTPNIAFATIPSSEKMFFLGLSQMIMQSEFSSGVQDISGVCKVLEEDLHTFLSSLDIRKTKMISTETCENTNYAHTNANLCEIYDIELFIGHENILPGIDSCSLIVSKTQNGEYFGILGPVRMNYSRNIVAMKEAQKLFLQLGNI
ncbi:TPA: hypothetical protein EYG96_00375 [Candidatus Gracilibacteria bacterium]|nr:hypothetical protein [Candidatus Peregrinibacteria bacterium]HIQ56484.1 hypothetical protein [Candidatus Gracilibacteria bacterium]HIQ57401.1 hypothetical protein [Candidatus Gracilibacteria bacterium]